MTLNPCDGVARKALDDGEIDFLSVDACARLLDRAAAAPVDCADEDFRDCLAYVALGLFCGPRPERELGRKEWSDVKLEDKLVVVSSGRSKTRAAGDRSAGQCGGVAAAVSAPGGTDRAAEFPAEVAAAAGGLRALCDLAAQCAAAHVRDDASGASPGRAAAATAHGSRERADAVSELSRAHDAE